MKESAVPGDSLFTPHEHYLRTIRFWYKSKPEVHYANDLHIRFLIDNPEVFDLTKDEIVKTYEAYGEPLGTEGKARIQLLKKVFRKGWIRGRYEQQQNTLFLETDNPEKRKKELRDCIDYLEDKFKPLLKDCEVKIL